MKAGSRLAWFNFRLTRCGNKAQKWYKRLWNYSVVAGLVIMMQQLCHSCCCTCSPRAHYVTKCQTMPPLRTASCLLPPPVLSLSPRLSFPLRRFFLHHVCNTQMSFGAVHKRRPWTWPVTAMRLLPTPPPSSHFTHTLDKKGY